MRWAKIKNQGCLEYTGCNTQLCGGLSRRIPLKQPGFHGKYTSCCFCSWLRWANHPLIIDDSCPWPITIIQCTIREASLPTWEESFSWGKRFSSFFLNFTWLVSNTIYQGKSMGKTPEARLFLGGVRGVRGVGRLTSQIQVELQIHQVPWNWWNASEAPWKAVVPMPWSSWPSGWGWVGDGRWP